ncbi:MAG TPA: polyprenyl synthetase family protein [Thermodesulfobacteriaceae bacterium]|nr:polyprenyl synthetase family protein [Thermodesulfobacteriaceae bacterium]
MNPDQHAFNLKKYLEEQRIKVEKALDRWLTAPEDISAPVFEAMKYSLMAGGKRVRPILVLAAGHAVNSDDSFLMPAACALECIHTYSLIHDDLPAMDDDDLRRGKPTCHKVYGETVAILAGDGLLTYAFELMTDPELNNEIPPATLSHAIYLMARAAGVYGMVGGQTADMQMEGKQVDADTLHFIHTRKTGALLQASIEIGAVLGGGTEEEIRRLGNFGRNLGLVFQIKDDLLDIEGDQEKLGKPVGSDDRNRKATYPVLFGIEATKKKARELLDQALAELEMFREKGEPLQAIARYVAERDR